MSFDISRPVAGRDPVVRVVTVIVGVIVGLTFLFGFGNVLAFGLRLGVPGWVAPLVAPAVDLSVLGLLIAIRHLSTRGAGRAIIRPAQRLLIASSVVTLALNVAEPLAAGEVGRALFDAVGPLLLIGWADVGPALLRELVSDQPAEQKPQSPVQERTPPPPSVIAPSTGPSRTMVHDRPGRPKATSMPRIDDEVLAQAIAADLEHRSTYQRPISAEGLMRTLNLGPSRSRLLMRTVRADWERRHAKAGMSQEPAD
jgi:hypothetical protein